MVVVLRTSPSCTGTWCDELKKPSLSVGNSLGGPRGSAGTELPGPDKRRQLWQKDMAAGELMAVGLGALGSHHPSIEAGKLRLVQSRHEVRIMGPVCV